MVAKTNNAFAKGQTALILDRMPDFDIDKYSEQLSFRYYKGTVFENINHFINLQDYKNPANQESRFKGKIYVIIGRNTVSAAEGFAIELSQNPNVAFLGEKTAGVLGNIYPIHLSSGLVVIINVCKTYDYKGNDVSSGISPDYEYDFSEFYKTEDANEMLWKFVEVIQEIRNKN